MKSESTVSPQMLILTYGLVGNELLFFRLRKQKFSWSILYFQALVAAGVIAVEVS